MSRRCLTVLVLTTTTLAIFGCGRQSTKTLTRTELIAKADAICGRVDAESGSITIRTQRDYARLLPPLAAYEQAASAQLRQLTPPASMASDWRQIVIDAQMVADSMTKVGEYAQSHKPASAPSALYAPAVKAVRQMLAIARRDGFQICAHRY